MDLHARLRRGERIAIDGGMASELQRRGARMHPIAWSALPLIARPDLVRDVHRAYIDAGARVLITNSFSTAPHVLRRAGMADHARELTTRAVRLAREAREGAGPAGEGVTIAGSLSASMGASGAPSPPYAELADSFRRHAELLATGGVDLIALEMMVDEEVTRAALEAARATGLPAWLGCSCAVDAAGAVRMFGAADRPRFDAFLDDVVDVAAPGFDALLVMHTDVEDVAAALAVARRHWRGPLGAYAHRGRYGAPAWRFDDAMTPGAYAAAAAGWVRDGAQLVGGCCGIGPDHVRAVASALDT